MDKKSGQKNRQLSPVGSKKWVMPRNGAGHSIHLLDESGFWAVRKSCRTWTQMFSRFQPDRLREAGHKSFPTRLYKFPPLGVKASKSAYKNFPTQTKKYPDAVIKVPRPSSILYFTPRNVRLSSRHVRLSTWNIRLSSWNVKWTQGKKLFLLLSETLSPAIRNFFSPFGQKPVRGFIGCRTGNRIKWRLRSHLFTLIPAQP